MPTPLTTAQMDQMALHVNELRGLANDLAASDVSEAMLKLYERKANNEAPTKLNVRVQRDPNMSTGEKSSFRGHINALANNNRDPLASDIANEMLQLYEETALGISGGTRDVTQTQLP